MQHEHTVLFIEDEVRVEEGMMVKLSCIVLSGFAALVFGWSASAAPLVYSHEFVQGRVYCPGDAQYDDWLNYRASLPTSDVMSVTVSGSQDPIGRTCSDPGIAQQIADAMRNRTFLSVVCDGFPWYVDSGCQASGCARSDNDLVLSAGGSTCSCSSTYNLRPGIGNHNWGGITGGSCRAPTQTMTVTIEVGGISCELEPSFGLKPPNTEHTLSASVADHLGRPVAGIDVTFEVESGPNEGDGGMEATDSNGEASFAYTGDGGLGVDDIAASFMSLEEIPGECSAEKFWDHDCQPNEIPDSCDLDCDAFDGRCGDFSGCGQSADEDADGVPDECNRDPVCSGAAGAPDELWPPDHKFEDVSVVGVSDPDGDPLTISVTGVAQDEPVEGVGDGNTCPDALGVGGDVASVRAERSGTKDAPGDGRVYHVSFRADDGQGGECEGEVMVCVPHDQGKGSSCVDGGAIYDSTLCGEPVPPRGH